MEDWLKDAKELAKSEAEYFVKNLIDVANTNNPDAEWFVEEVVNNIHKIWSDGYFACSIGEVSSATIQKYIESQG